MIGLGFSFYDTPPVGFFVDILLCSEDFEPVSSNQFIGRIISKLVDAVVAEGHIFHGLGLCDVNFHAWPLYTYSL